MSSHATASTTVTVTTTEAHVRQFMEIWRQGSHKTSPFSKSNPLALALFEQTGLPIQVYCEYFTLHGETITLEGLPEDVRAFVGSVSGVLREMGWDGWKDARKCALGLEKLLGLVPFRFEFDTMGLGEDSDSETESVHRQEMEAESSPQSALGHACVSAQMEAPQVLHFVSACCRGEKCRICGQQATHKLGEEIFPDDPSNRPQWEIAGLPGPRLDRPLDNIAVGRHDLTAYVCCRHFSMVVGPAAPCFDESRGVIDDPSLEKVALNACFAFRRFLDNVSTGPKPSDDKTLEAAQWDAVQALETEASLWCHDALRLLGVNPGTDPRLELDPDSPLMEIGDDKVDTFRSVIAEIYGPDIADKVAEEFRARTLRPERKTGHA